MLACTRLVSRCSILCVPLGQPARQFTPWLRLAEPASRLAGIDDALPKQLAGHGQGLKVGEVAVIDHGQQTARAVAQPKDAVHFVGQISQLLTQHAKIDLDHAVQRRQSLKQPGPFVEPPHSLHEQRCRRKIDDISAPNGLELDLEPPIRPREQAVHCLGARQPAYLGVDDPPLAEENRPTPAIAIDDVNDAGFPVKVDGLHQIHHPDVRQVARELGAPFAT